MSMMAHWARFIDWLVLQSAAQRLPPSSGLEESLQFLQGPDFIPAESKTAQVEFNSHPPGLHFRFPTPRPCSLPENNVVYGRLYRCTAFWRKRPTVVLLHGGGDFLSHWFGFPLVARRCNRMGFSAVTLELPYHFHRRPRHFEGLNSLDCLQLVETFAQAIAEIRALSGWLLAAGCPAVALWGVSWGASLAGLSVCRDSRLAAVVLSMPAVRFNTNMELIFRRSIREAWESRRPMLERLNSTPLNLTSSQPAISANRILLIEALYDLCVGSEPIEQLWQVWGKPDLWRLAHGHVTSFAARGITQRVLHWLVPRLDERAVNQRATGAAQPDVAADGSQPIRSETTRMSSAAGPRR
jgi:pimeloyl-ACP methyl ester carboxylesterase